MRHGLALLVAAAVACGAQEPSPPERGEARAPLALPPESDLHPTGTFGRPALLPDGRRVEARAGHEPGESDLWLVEPGGAATPLCPAPGPDEMPVATPDGRVVFLSGRTTVASLFIADPRTGVATQLTNRGLVAGRPWSHFVPPPSREARVEGNSVRYTDGSGRRWRVDLATGAAEAEP